MTLELPRKTAHFEFPLGVTGGSYDMFLVDIVLYTKCSRSMRASFWLILLYNSSAYTRKESDGIADSLAKSPILMKKELTEEPVRGRIYT